jgi:hypothetical protein
VHSLRDHIDGRLAQCSHGGRRARPARLPRALDAGRGHTTLHHLLPSAQASRRPCRVGGYACCCDFCLGPVWSRADVAGVNVGAERHVGSLRNSRTAANAGSGSSMKTSWPMPASLKNSTFGRRLNSAAPTTAMASLVP